MNPAAHEPTAPINLDELHRLLNTMTPAQQQAITTRAAISDIEAELARVGATVAPPKVEPPRRSAPPFSRVAALLPPAVPIRAPRAARPTQSTRAKTQVHSLAVAEHKAPRTVAELRARLDSGETAAQWATSGELSPQVLACLSAEEIAMLPAGLRGSLPGVSEPTPAPVAEVVDIKSEQGAALLLAADAPRQRFAANLASLAVLLLGGIWALYLLV